MGFLTGFGGWLISIVLGKVGREVLQKAFDLLGRSADGAARLEEIRVGAATKLAQEDTERHRISAAALNERQSIKMNQPMFWVLIAIMIGPPAVLMWSVGLYNIFWWEHGVWPQAWSIADFPPSIKPWANAAINWLYDPLGPPTAVGSSFIASILAGRR